MVKPLRTKIGKIVKGKTAIILMALVYSLVSQLDSFGHVLYSQQTRKKGRDHFAKSQMQRSQ